MFDDNPDTKLGLPIFSPHRDAPHIFHMEYQQFVHVTVFDLRTKTKIAAATIQGGYQGSPNNSNPTPPSDKILLFLAALPREPKTK
jgi:hypothetical protein